MQYLEKLTNRKYDLSILLIVAIIVTVSALSHDIYRDITSEADSDFTGVYNALRFNDDLPQSMFDHTGYVYFVILSVWLKILNFFSIVPISKMSEMPGPDSFEPIWSALIYAGRSLSIVLSILSGFLFYFITKLICENRNIAAAMGILFAFSPGLVRQSLVMHTELPSFALFLFALLFALNAGRSKPWAEIGYVILAAFCATLAAMSKMHIIPLLLALPIVALIINAQRVDRRRLAASSYSLPMIAGVGFLLLSFSVPAQVMIWTKVFPALPELAGLGTSSNGGYQLLIAGYLGFVVCLYKYIDRRLNREMFLVICAIFTGIAFAFYFNFLHHNTQNTAKLVNFVDSMSRFAPTFVAKVGDDLTGSQLAFGLLISLGDKFLGALESKYLVLDMSTWPLTLMYWAVTFSILYMLAQRQWHFVLKLSAFLCISLGMDTFSTIRSSAEHYRIFYELWILFASAIIVQFILSSRYWHDLRYMKLHRIFVISLISVVYLYTFAGSVSRASTKVIWHDRQYGCSNAQGYMRDLIGHFCTGKFLNPAHIKSGEENGPVSR